mmetsp:Transcript_9843/g.17979  ORF Transcript_9843/g.17979 Transcript_9843/m.17979 type:complete len:101 (+) Transcript_9843:101-403(+)
MIYSTRIGRPGPAHHKHLGYESKALSHIVQLAYLTSFCPYNILYIIGLDHCITAFWFPDWLSQDCRLWLLQFTSRLSSEIFDNGFLKNIRRSAGFVFDAC